MEREKVDPVLFSETQDIKEGTQTIKQMKEEEARKKDMKENPEGLNKLLQNSFGIKFNGYLQNSYTSNLRQKEDLPDRNFFLFPNRLPNSWQGNQYYLVVEKPAIQTKRKLDIGFRIDSLYGNDWEFTKSFGLMDCRFDSGTFYGYDFPQAYAEINLPFFFQKNATLILGRFYNPGDYEGKMAIKRPLFSSSYMINSTPFTFLGSLLSVRVTSQLTVLGGITNGADRFYNALFRPSALGGFNYAPNDKFYFKSVSMVGPNQLPRYPGLDERNLPIGIRTNPQVQWTANTGYASNLRFYSSNVISYKMNKHWKVSKEISLNHDQNTPLATEDGRSRDTYWKSIGVWLYFDKKGDEKLTFIQRAELFSDYQGIVTGQSGRYIAWTSGLAWKPNSRVWVRPEVRVDHALNRPVFQSGESRNRVTLALDFFLFF
jgi:hypothetical protein